MDIYVGKEVYLKPFGMYAKRNPGLIKGTIRKVAKKYFYVNTEIGTLKMFDVNTLKDINSKNKSYYVLYLSKESLVEENEEADLRLKFKRIFDECEIVELSLQQLRDIDKIIKLDYFKVV